MSEVLQLPDFSTPRARVAAEVRAEMARWGVSGNRLPKFLGKSQAYWSRRLTGEVAFDVDDLQALADLLHVPVVRFFGLDGERPRPGGPDGGVDAAVRHQGLEPRTRWFRARERGEQHPRLVEAPRLLPVAA